MSLSQLQTTVRNMSGRELFLDFLPPYGQILAADASYTGAGSIWDWCKRNGIMRQSLIDAVKNALDNNLIDITGTPVPVILDSVANRVRTINISSGTLGVTDPSYYTHTTTTSTTT